MKHVTVYSDGSCQNPRRKGGSMHPGGCAAIVVWEGAEEALKFGNGELQTFVNRMELLGAITGMRYLHWCWHQKPEEEQSLYLPKNLHVEIITDSAYMFRAAIGLSKRSANPDLWQQFNSYGSTFGKLTVEHRPRNTHRWMEEADRVAGIIRQKIIGEDAAILECISKHQYFEADI